MIESLSSWAKSIILAVIVVSILEMILPNNKIKKYIKMVMGVFVLFNIISPLVNEKDLTSLSNLDIDEYTQDSNAIIVNQQSMNEKLETLYIQEIEKDITKKVEKKGYIVNECEVTTHISDDEDETGITKIVLKIEKDLTEKSETEEDDEQNVENKIVTEIQKIKKVDTTISEEESQENDTSISKTDIQNIKLFLIEEYEVEEKCLEIN